MHRNPSVHDDENDFQHANVVISDYAINVPNSSIRLPAEATRSEYVVPQLQGRKVQQEKKDEYANPELRDLVNKAIIDTKEKSKVSVISARKLRAQVSNLDDAVYVPTVVNGELYFVSLNDDTRTARNREFSLTRTALSPISSSHSIENVKTANEASVSLSLAQLQDILGVEAVQAVLKKFKENPSAFMKRARNRSRHRGQSSSAISCASPSNSNTSEKGVKIARSIEYLVAMPEEGVFTAQEIDTDILYTGRSEGVKGLKLLMSERSSVDTALDRDGFELTVDNFADTNSAYRWNSATPKKATVDMRSRITQSSRSTPHHTSVSDVTTAYSHRDGAITARSDSFTSLGRRSTTTALDAQYGFPPHYDMRTRHSSISSTHSYNPLSDDTSTAANIGSPYKATVDMRSRAYPSSSYERTARSDKSMTATGVYGDSLAPVGGDMRTRAIPSSSFERTAQAKTSSTNTAVYGNQFGPVACDMRSRAQPASSDERTANANTSSTNTALINEAVGVDMRSRAFPSSSYDRTAQAKTSSTNTAVYGSKYGPVGGDMRSRAQPASSIERTEDVTSTTSTALFGDKYGPVGNDMRSRAIPSSSYERTAQAKTSSTNTALLNEAVGMDMRSRAYPSSSHERTAQTKTSSTNTALLNEAVRVDMRCRAFPSSSYEITVKWSSNTNTALCGNQFGPVNGDMRSRAQPASSYERTANEKTSSTNTALLNEAVGVDMRSKAFPSSSYERTARSSSNTSTAVYGNQFGPVNGDMRSRAQPASSYERTANAKTSSTNTAVYGDQFGPVGGDMRSRAIPLSSFERTPAKVSKSGQEIDNMLNSILSEVTAMNDGDITSADELRTAADRDNSLAQVHPSVLTQTPLSDCTAAAAVPSIGNMHQ